MFEVNSTVKLNPNNLFKDEEFKKKIQSHKSS